MSGFVPAHNYDYRSMPDELQTLVERRDYLVTLIARKKSLGWETLYDEREHNALCWALTRLRPPDLGDGA